MQRVTKAPSMVPTIVVTRLPNYNALKNKLNVVNIWQATMLAHRCSQKQLHMVAVAHSAASAKLIQPYVSTTSEPASKERQ